MPAASLRGCRTRVAASPSALPKVFKDRELSAPPSSPGRRRWPGGVREPRFVDRRSPAPRFFPSRVPAAHGTPTPNFVEAASLRLAATVDRASDPASDVDVMFLHAQRGKNCPELARTVEQILYFSGTSALKLVTRPERCARRWPRRMGRW